MARGVLEHRHTVLLIDDNDDLREAFVMLAAAVDLIAVTFGNARAALDALRGGLRPCVILLDLAMPEMDGFAFRRQQLQDPALRDIPVAIVSGTSELLAPEAGALGLTTFLRKPVEITELLRLFAEHCAVDPSRLR